MSKKVEDPRLHSGDRTSGTRKRAGASDDLVTTAMVAVLNGSALRCVWSGDNG